MRAGSRGVLLVDFFQGQPHLALDQVAGRICHTLNQYNRIVRNLLDAAAVFPHVVVPAHKISLATVVLNHGYPVLAHTHDGHEFQLAEIEILQLFMLAPAKLRLPRKPLLSAALGNLAQMRNKRIAHGLDIDIRPFCNVLHGIRDIFIAFPLIPGFRRALFSEHAILPILREAQNIVLSDKLNIRIVLAIGVQYELRTLQRPFAVKVRPLRDTTIPKAAIGKNIQLNACFPHNVMACHIPGCGVQWPGSDNRQQARNQ